MANKTRVLYWYIKCGSHVLVDYFFTCTKTNCQFSLLSDDTTNLGCFVQTLDEAEKDQLIIVEETVENGNKSSFPLLPV